MTLQQRPSLAVNSKTGQYECVLELFGIAKKISLSREGLRGPGKMDVTNKTLVCEGRGNVGLRGPGKMDVEQNVYFPTLGLEPKTSRLRVCHSTN